LLVHIGDPSSNQVTTLESHMIHMIQELFGQTLRSWEASNGVTKHSASKSPPPTHKVGKKEPENRSAPSGRITSLKILPVKTSSDIVFNIAPIVCIKFPHFAIHKQSPPAPPPQAS
jgi:hypothetical protein